MIAVEEVFREVVDWAMAKGMIVETKTIARVKSIKKFITKINKEPHGNLEIKTNISARDHLG